MRCFSLLQLSLCVLAVFSGGLSLAKETALPTPVNRPVDFVKEVHPILAERCYSCHAGDKKRGGFQLDSRETLLKGGESGPAVVLGKSEESYLIKLVGGIVPDLVMPKSGPRLSPEEVGVLRAWVDQGLAWDAGAAQPTVGKWVAPLALRRPEPPAPQDEQASNNPIDLLLQPYFVSKGIAPREPVSDNLFVRRATLDVTGLLPTTQEAAEFTADPDSNKREGLVRRLLAKNQAYAEHWISFWNDLLRNDFQGTGYIDGGREPITGWLYFALLNNMKYDQFVTQLINPTDGNDGFINGIVWRGETAAAVTPAMQAGGGIALVFLGVNLKCASCHDSFVNEWKLKDAYGMANVFSDKPLELVRCDVPQGVMAETKFLWPELGAIDADRPRTRRLSQLAALVTKEENGRTPRTIVNRLWAKFFGRGLVEPLDDMAQEPWNADLLDWLASDLVDNGYDLKKTVERMLTSRAYALPSVATDPQQPSTAYAFQGPEVRRLSAEEFMDALSVMTGAWQTEPKFALPNLDPKADPSIVRAWRVNADGLTRAMGRPNRDNTTTRRQEDATTLQALELTNGETLAGWLKRGSEKLSANGAVPARERITALYTQAVQRPPSERELELALAMTGDPVTPEGQEDLLWAIAMLPDFQYVY